MFKNAVMVSGSEIRDIGRRKWTLVKELVFGVGTLNALKPKHKYICNSC